jgi:shikimate kinase
MRNILFLGPSGVGKSYWSKLISPELNLTHIEFDDLIGKSEKLSNLLVDISGKDEAEKLGKYFGKPTEKGFDEKEEKYLEIEKELMDKDYEENKVLDLTGSAIYHEEELKKLKEKGIVIYLMVDDDVKKEMFELYLAEPKPVCWKKTFKKKEGETDIESLERNYPKLLDFRLKLYEKYADIKIPYEKHKDFKNAKEFIQYLKNNTNFSMS